MPRRLLIPVAAAAALAAALIVPALRPPTAAAHPLGNFTINNYDRIEVSDGGLSVFHVLDMAEIPTFQERQQRIDADGDGEVTDAEAQAWAVAKADDLRPDLRLVVDGDDLRLTPDSPTIAFLEGQGGLLILRMTVTYRAALPDGWRDAPPRVEFEDTAYGDRIGWREVIVRGAGGVEVFEASAPATDISDELRSYPQNSLSSPLDRRSATFSFRPGFGLAPAPQPTADPKPERATRGNPDSTLARFADLIAKKELGPGVIALALLAAMAFGMLHALSPGHGKTVVGAYLVGSRGTARHALLLGATVTATHTSSVYAIGFVTLYLSEYIVPERLYPWLGVASGGLIVGMGVLLFVGRIRSSGLWADASARVRTLFARRPAPELVLATGEAGAVLWPMTGGGVAHGNDRAHDAGGHGHDHGPSGHDAGDHRHGLGAAHSHGLPGQDGEPVSWRQLIGLGIFGGMLPCPSAIVVMLSAVALHRVGFGLLLIVAFSLGLAIVLTGIGLALVWSRRVPWVRRIAERTESSRGLTGFAVRAFPVVAAAFVTGAGAVILARAVGQM